MPKADLKIVDVEEGRAYRRVVASLDGALCIPDMPITMMRTCNISEGGIAISHNKVIRPKPGTQVKVELNGIVSSSSDNGLDIYDMQVVYSRAGMTGLAFKHNLQHS